MYAEDALGENSGMTHVRAETWKDEYEKFSDVMKLCPGWSRTMVEGESAADWNRIFRKNTASIMNSKNELIVSRLGNGYNKAMVSGSISPLTGIEVYRSTAKSIKQQVVGLTTSDGIEISNFKSHLIDSVIGQIADPHPGKREGVPVEKVRRTLLTGVPKDTIRTDGKTSRKYIVANCEVTINPDTQTIIQVNPKGGIQHD